MPFLTFFRFPVFHSCSASAYTSSNTLYLSLVDMYVLMFKVILYPYSHAAYICFIHLGHSLIAPLDVLPIELSSKQTVLLCPRCVHAVPLTE